MSEVKQFRLPDVGEGLTEADIVAWHVKPGDSVTLNQVIVEIETAKAVVELPSPYEGVVTELLAEEGSTVDVGAPIIAVDVSGEATTDGAGRPATTDVPAGSTPAGTPAATDRGSASASIFFNSSNSCVCSGVWGSCFHHSAIVKLPTRPSFRRSTFSPTY